MLTPEQVAERRSGVGGSDAPALIGADPFKTAFEIACTKLGLIEPDDISEQENIIWGNLLERVVGKEFARRNNVKVRARSQTFRSEVFPFALAHLDFDIDRTTEALEVKTTIDSSSWGKSGSDEVPDRVRIQCQHYLAVFPKKTAWNVAALIRGSDYRQYRIERDDGFIKDLMAVEAEFWAAVQRGELPDPDWSHRRTSDVLKRLYPGTDGSTIDLPELETWTKVYLDAVSWRSQYESVVDVAKNHIQRLMGPAAIGKIPGEKVWQRKVVDRSAYTVEATKYVDMRLVNAPKPPSAKGKKDGTGS